MIQSVPKNKSGMAIVIVLGILSIMVIMAFSFAVLMRTDRVASANYLEEVRCRQLIDIAIVRALASLTNELGEKGLKSPNAKVYPSWLVTTSSGELSWTNCLYALTNFFSNYIPHALWNKATNKADEAQWINIETTVNNKNYIVGRVAFLILNCSGLLDANIIGGNTRGYGTNPTEITINYLRDFANSGEFLAKRSTEHIYYEDMYELNNYARWLNSPVTNLFTYSYAKAGFWDNIQKTDLPQVNLAGGVSEIQSRHQEITNLLVKYCSLSKDQANIFFTNLLDYLDTDLTPRDFTYSVEAVPMLNEFKIENVGLGAQMETKISVEMWCPFAYSTQFQLIVRCTTDVSGNTKSSTNTFTNTPSGYTTIDSAVVVLDNSNSSYNVTIEAQIKSHTGEIVDVIQARTINMQYNKTKSLQVANPLYNYENSKWQEFDTPTYGTINANIGSPSWDPSLIPLCNDTTNGYLRSLGELGNIIYDKDWKSIKLYGPSLHPVLSIFGLSINPNETYVSTNIVRFGLVNPNSGFPDVIGALIDNIPVSLGKILAASNPEVQTKIINTIVGNSGKYTNVSDIGRAWSTPTDFPTACATEQEREAVIGNLVGLLNTRQQLFTILIEAQSASGGRFFSRNPTYERAVAIVWRDAFTGECFVRKIRYLPE